MDLKVIAVNGSARKDGNTAIMLRRACQVLEREGIETELIQLAGMTIHGCRVCGACKKGTGRCAFNNDVVNEFLSKAEHVQGFLLGSPTYFADLTPELKALIDRAGYVGRANGMFRRKIGAAVTVARRGGNIHTFDSINHFFTINEMLIVGSSYWNDGLGAPAGAVEQDEEAMRTMDTLGENMAWAMKKLYS